MKGNDTQETYKNEGDMRKNRLFTTICLMAAILFTACTQDELAEQGNTLPDGEYPLRIGSVSITAEASEEPWTRVAENETDGMGSHWTGDEEFYVKFEGSDEVGIYKITDAATGAVVPVKSIYWKNTQPAKIIAWYANPQPNSANWMYLNSQDNGLAYVLRATADNASYDTPVSLQFKHQLAKVRVVTKGTVDVRHIAVTNAPVGCSVQDGIVTSGVNERVDNYLYETEYEGIGTCWEICLPPCSVQRFMVMSEAGGSSYFDIDNSVTLEAGKVHTITITAVIDGTQTIDLSTLTDTREINDNGTYYVTGTGQYGIRVTNGKPNIYLEDAQISVSSGNAIDITGGASPTIHVKGNDNEVSSSDGAGIYVAEGYSVTITSDDKTANSITLTGKGGAGIGGYLASGQHSACGNIIIQNVTVIASSSYSLGMQGYNPGIGGSGNAACGKISITNAIVYAYGSNGPNQGSPAIGAGLDDSMNPGSVPTIQIETSDIYAHRGNYADYIGQSGDRNNSRGDFQFGQEGYCRSSNVYCYTGSSDTLDKTVTYDASGNATEQPQ